MTGGRSFRLPMPAIGIFRFRAVGALLLVLVGSLVVSIVPLRADEHGGEEAEPPAKPDPNARPAIQPAPGAPAYVTVPLFIIPVIEGGQVTRQVSVGIAMELVKGKTLQDIKPKEAVLTDAFLRELYGLFGQRAAAERIAEPPIIKARLQRVADRVLGPGIVKQVLILQLFERVRPS